MTDTATHIRRLFLKPKESYSVRDAAEILCMPLPDVLGWMEVGELEGVDTAHGVMLPWGELASFGMDFWSQEALTKAIAAASAQTSPTPSPSSSAWPTWKCASPASRSWPWNASPTATASRSTPSSPASCWMSYPPTRST
ncbi:MAG TPA: hypothetical protein VN380_05595 [Thermoanaerobaculia bacterium]|nr:hypothetical protein [Thermoanaerobaculia bacterium]